MTGGGGVMVRPAVAADVEPLLLILAAVVDEGRWLGAEGPIDVEADRRRFAQRMDDPASGVTLVAVVHERVAGYAVVDLAPYHVGSLVMMVDAAWRGRGVGSALVPAAIDWCRRAGAHKLALQVWPHNATARALYRRHGFAEEGTLRRHYRRRNGELWDAVVMGLVLDEASPGPSLPA